MTLGAKQRFWTEKEVEILKNNYGKTPVRVWRGKLPNRTYNAILTKAKTLGLQSSLVKATTTSRPKFKDLPVEYDEQDTLEELWEKLYDYQETAKKLSNRVDEVTISIDTEIPIAICFVADAHIGPISTPLRAVRDRFLTMARYPWLYLIGAGDKVDNFLPGAHPQGMFEQLMPPALQKELVEDLYSKSDRWLALVQGCHDEFSHRTDDFDFTAYMTKRLGCANLGFGGLINLKVGSAQYQIAVRHKYRYNSSFNYTHTCKRLRERQYPNADIVCVAHHHVTTYEHMVEADKDRLYIRPGTMKHPDRYARSLGYIAPGESLPVVVLDPNQRRMTPYLSLERAEDYLGNIGYGE